MDMIYLERYLLGTIALPAPDGWDQIHNQGWIHSLEVQTVSILTDISRNILIV